MTTTKTIATLALLLLASCGRRTPQQTSDASRPSMSINSAQPADPRFSDIQIECLARAMWAEAGNQPVKGQIAVAEVIIHRTADRRFKERPCDVIRQPRQFSIVEHGSIPQIPDDGIAGRLRLLARMVVAGRARSGIGDALFFHATYVSPKWTLKRLGRIGDHVFYTDIPGSYWSTARKRILPS